jgi:hypothetical protein
MDIHKPKPWRGVREFGKELGTIVLGVLIALGAEQAVEWLHRGAEVRETREALRDELGLNLRNIRYSQVEDRCTDGHIAVWSAWARGGPKPVFTNGVFPSMAFAAWDVAKAGPLAHMPLRERLAPWLTCPFASGWLTRDSTIGWLCWSGPVRANWTRWPTSPAIGPSTACLRLGVNR